MSSVGERLREVRESVEGLSARELDRLSGLSEGHVSLIESGDRSNPTKDTFASVCAVLGIEAAPWIIFGLGKKPSAASVRAAVDKARSARSAA